MSVQEKRTTERRPWQLLFLLLVLLGTLLICSGMAMQSALQRGPALIPISLRSTLQANYGADHHVTLLSPVRMNIILEVIRDQEPLIGDAAARATRVAHQLQTPVPTITPVPGQPSAGATPTLVARATGTPTPPKDGPALPSPTPTQLRQLTPTPTSLSPVSVINTPVYTSTATATQLPTATATSTATATQTPQPTLTPTPSATPTPTDAPPPPPPTNTPIPTNTPTATPEPFDAIDDTAITEEDTEVTIQVLLNDPGGTLATVTAAGTPTNGTVTTNGTTITYTPNPDFHGNDTFSYTATNGYQTDTAVVKVTVNPVNDRPSAVDDAATVDEGGTVTVLDSSDTTVLGNDSDVEGQNLSAVLISGPIYAASFTLSADGTFSYTHDGSESVADSFTYQACDDGTPSACKDATVTIAIISINDPPDASDDTGTTSEGGTITTLDSGDTSVLANDADPEGGTLTVDTVPAVTPTRGTLVLNGDGSFSYTHDGSETNSDSFAYRVCDDGTPSLCSTATVYLAILPVNDPPLALDDATDVVQGNTAITLTIPNGAFSVLDNDSDPEGDLLTASTVPVVIPIYGTLVLNSDGSFSYTHDGSATTSDGFSYQVCDAGTPSLCDTATVSITISPARPWWNCEYAYRKAITVTTGASAVSSGHPIPLEFNHNPLVASGKSQADGDDIRVLYWDGSTWHELDRVLDAQSAWDTPPLVRIWFGLQSGLGAFASDGNYYLYYGNPGAGNPQSEGLTDWDEIFAPPVDANTSALWYIEDTSAGTTLIDSSGNSNDGSLNNGTGRTEGRYSGGLFFDGVDDYVNVAHDPTLSAASLTVEAWVYLDGVIGEQHIIDKRAATGGYNLRVDGGSFPLRLRWIIRDATGAEFYANAPGVINDATWYHVAGTWDGATQRLYVNGSLVSSDSPTLTVVITNSTADLIFGGIAGAPETNNLAGRIDGVRISAIARTSFPYAEVATEPTTALDAEETRPVPCP